MLNSPQADLVKNIQTEQIGLNSLSAEFDGDEEYDGVEENQPPGRFNESAELNIQATDLTIKKPISSP